MNIVEICLAFFVGLMFLILFCFIFSVSFTLFQKLLLNVLFGAIIYVILAVFNVVSLNILGAVIVGGSGSIGAIAVVIFSFIL